MEQSPKPNQIHPDTLEQLESILAESGVPLDSWATGSAKTVAHLFKEINDGETVLSRGEAGQLRRDVSVVWLDVFGRDASGQRWHLVEDRQEFSDGRVRRRQLSVSLGEKMLPDEPIEVAAKRALHEELGLTGGLDVEFIGSQQTTHTPDSYPGLASHYQTHTLVTELPPELFQPIGYQEVQPDKTTYFVWELAES